MTPLTVSILLLSLLGLCGWATYHLTARNTTLPEGALLMLGNGELPEAIWVPDGDNAQNQQIALFQAAKRLSTPMSFYPLRLPGKGILLTPRPL